MGDLIILPTSGAIQSTRDKYPDVNMHALVYCLKLFALATMENTSSRHVRKSMYEGFLYSGINMPMDIVDHLYICLAPITPNIIKTPSIDVRGYDLYLWRIPDGR